MFVYLDIFCYVCNDSKLDPFLENHLSNFGINIKSQQKTEKNMTELVCIKFLLCKILLNIKILKFCKIFKQIEENLKYDFSMVTEDGKELEPLFGPGYTGIKNLGNRFDYLRFTRLIKWLFVLIC